ncbi:hypothetical protein NL533_35185, partial [Klebsiella pneumoniae]|nr:hypothetical protein [Klebsiella pneumoniae]
ILKGLGAAWNFTMGPVFIYEGPASIGAINKVIEPVVVVAHYIPEMELKKIDRFRVRGYVIETANIIDPTYWMYREDNRA